MRMKYVGTNSGVQGCPTLWITDRGTLVVQGTTVTDPDAFAAMRGCGNVMPDYESAVEVPAELLPFVDIEALQHLPFADEERPEFTINPEATSRLADTLTGGRP